MKWSGMLVALLRGVNYGLCFQLANILPLEVLIRVACEEMKK